MHQSIPQRVITLSIVGDDEDAYVTYSYVSPVTGLVYINAPVCDVLVDRPIHTLYVLDYTATLNGWTVTGTSPHEGSPTLKSVLGAGNLSIMTSNPHKSHDTYAYYIHYTNTCTHAIIKRDPQEVNVPPRDDEFTK